MPGAFATVSVGFLGATALSEARATAIDRQIESVEGNSLPSVEHLEMARAALRHLDVGAMQYAGAVASERSEAHDAIDKARSALLREMEAENATPDYPGERELRVDFATLPGWRAATPAITPSEPAQDDEGNRLIAALFRVEILCMYSIIPTLRLRRHPATTC